jgi:hypothetical protein
LFWSFVVAGRNLSRLHRASRGPCREAGSFTLVLRKGTRYRAPFTVAATFRSGRL